MSMEEACAPIKTEIEIKDEPFSETESQHSSCSSSPHHHHQSFIHSSDNSVDKYFVDDLVVS